MKSGIVTSTVLHGAALTWGLWSFSSPTPLDVSYAEALPVEIVMADVFEGMVGEREAPVADTPAPIPTEKPETLPMPAENVGENEADLDTPPIPDVEPTEVEPTAAASPPEPAPPEPEPEPVEAAAEPAPEPAPVPEPVAAETAEPLPDPIEQAIAEAEPAPAPLPENVPVPQNKPRPPAPQVAEAPEPEAPEEPEPEAQEPQEPEERQTEVAEAPAQEESEFDADQIAALLSQTKASGGGAERSQEQAALGTRETTGTQLSRSEIGELQGMIRDQMERCWSPPTGVSEAGSLRISIQMSLDPAGQLSGVPAIIEGGGGSSVERVAGEAALRAVRRCAPYNLPTDKYEAWAEVVLNFDPSQMY